jgi:hypothetical protein
MNDPPTDAPNVPTDRLDAGDWALAEDTTETLFSLPTGRVQGRTLLYEDATLRKTIRTATDGNLDMPWRFFFTTRLSFLPPLAPRIGPTTILPTVMNQARRRFAADLEDRGFRRVKRGRTQRTRTASGERIRLTKYTARISVERYGEQYDIDIDGWVGVWIRSGEFRLAGGAYPTSGFDAVLDTTDVERNTAPNEYRDDLLGLIRAVE